MPWLTVVLPTYNGCPHLLDALEGLCRQECADFSVIAIDDGSTDETRSVLADYSGRLPLSIIEREHQGNWITNTNLGMSRADSPYIGWLHQDDLWEPNRVSTLKELAEVYPAAPMLFHPSWYIDELGNRLRLWRCPLGRETARLDANLVHERLVVQNFLAVSATLFRRDVLEESGLADEDLWYTGDWDYWLKLLNLGDPVYCPTPMSAVRIHERSQTSTRCNHIDELRRQYEITLDRHLRKPVSSSRRHMRTAELARFSAEANLLMMQYATGRRQGIWRLLFRFATLGPIGWYVFLRDSRIIERVAARIRVSQKRPSLRGTACH